MDSAHIMRQKLIRQLRRAYSGEQAAAYAYRGHWASVRNPDERAKIRDIEEDEWRHRRLALEMLNKLGGRPSIVLEIRTWIIGRVLGVACHLIGWFLPMWAAGKLEHTNVQEYVDAALYARGAGCDEFIEPLLHLAEVEWDHEKYFLTKVIAHPFTRVFPLWTLTDRDSIRAEFQRTSYVTT